MNRIRDDCASALRQELAAVQSAMAASWTAALDDLRRDISDHRVAALERQRLDHDDLAGALDRLADALEGVTAALDAERRERIVQIELVECLLREMIIGWAPQLPERAKVVGGSIDTHLLGGELMETAIDLRVLESIDSDAELTVGTPVEVRSHFHDRWSNGFLIAEVVHDTGGRRFKLTRRSDGSSLPLLFDATDVRRQLATHA